MPSADGFVGALNLEDHLRRVSRLINTSVEDCRAALRFESDLDVLNAAFHEAERRGHVTRLRAIATRISTRLKETRVAATKEENSNGR